MPKLEKDTVYPQNPALAGVKRRTGAPRSYAFSSFFAHVGASKNQQFERLWRGFRVKS